MRSFEKGRAILKAPNSATSAHLSDYTLNKDNPDAIVYRDVNGHLTYLTAKDFTSKAEFEKWKKWSDADYAEIEKGDRQYYDHKVPLFDQDITTPSVEDEVLRREKRRNRIADRQRVIAKALATLTPTQKRRFVMYYGENMTFHEISQIESVNSRAVWDSIKQAKKKIFRYNCKHSMNYTQKNGHFSVLSEGGNMPLLNLENLIDNAKGTKPT